MSIIKKINVNVRFNRKKVFFITFILITSLILILIALYSILTAVNNFYDNNHLIFNKVVEIKFNKPIVIEERKLETTEIATVIQMIPEYEDLETDIEKYICEKFGPYDCKVAIAVAKAESGLREDAVGINTNKTIDVGIFQINTVHFKKDGCNLKDLVDQYKNVDCAFQIWEAQGWSPWVAYTNGNFKNTL